MTWRPFALAGGCYEDDTLPWSAQDTVNWIPVMAEVEGTRTPVMLRGVPGLSPTAANGDAFSAFDSSGARRSGVVFRGAYNADGVFLLVQGTTCYRYNGDWKAPTVVGTVPGVGRVTFAHNQITGGSQIVIANGTAGYVYNTVDGTFAQITDEAFPGAKSVDYIDSYIVAVEPGGRYWFTSDLADATSYNALNRYEAESAPDKIVGLIVSHNEVIVFGERTMEFYYDSGADTVTFQRRSGTQTEVGAASQHAIVKLDNTVYWLGNDGIVYMLNGYTPVRISKHPIEQQIERVDISKCFALVYEDRGHKIVYFTFPDGLTWGYDVSTQVWHRRKSYGLKRWRANTLTKWGTKWYAGDYTNGSLCTMDWGVNTENFAPLVAERKAAVIQAEMNRFRLSAVDLSVDSQKSVEVGGVPALTVSGDVPDSSQNAYVHAQYAVSDALGPYVVTLDSGALPAGLSLSSNGRVDGQYTTQGSFSWAIRATDLTGRTATHADTCVVGAPYNWSWTKGSTNPENISRLMIPYVDTVDGAIRCGGDTNMYESSDGLAWTITASRSGPTPIYQTRNVDGTNGAIFACWADSSNAGHLFRRKRTESTWTEIKDGTTTYTSKTFICSANGILYCQDASSGGVASRFSSDDGATWSAVSVPASFNPGDSALTFRGMYIEPWGAWVIPGQNEIYEAAGASPTAIAGTFSSAARLGCVAYSPATDVAVVSGDTALYRNGKGDTWHQSDLSVSVNSVDWCDALGVFVAPTGVTNQLYISADGAHWTLVTQIGLLSTVTWCRYAPWLSELVAGPSSFDGTQASMRSNIP